MLLYIDPGTGSMLFTVLLGLIGAAVYSLRMLFIKLRFAISGGKAKADTGKIPLAIFSDDKRYWSIFSPICRELDKRGVPVLYMTASPDDPGLDNPYEHVRGEFIGAGNKAFSKLNFLNATILFSTTPGLDVYQWKRSKNVDYYVHIFHTAGEVTRYRMFGIDYYDALMIAGDHQERDIRQLEEKRNLPAKELVTVGIPFMDEMAARLASTGPAAEHPRTVLLAPTWGPSAIFSIHGGKIIDKLLETGYHIIIRPHPQSFASETELLDKLMKDYPESDQLEWNRDTDNFEVLRRSDILISDFSGVVFDFSLIYDKPVIYTDPNFNLAPYDAWFLDHPLWTFSALPRIGQELNMENLDNIKELIDACLEDPRYAQGRQEVRNETWAYPGEGAVRAADYLMAKYASLTETKNKGSVAK
ncbi:MAG: CDP-glycerol glycerophosphotransferase family protein [Oscillospiraceae bacterium]|nr:CDP-glycerol glycerophosphotransferase family protein [Oscillospiraceae bacterium]